MATTLAYYDTATISAVNSFIVQAPRFDYDDEFYMLVDIRHVSQLLKDVPIGIEQFFFVFSTTAKLFWS
jgi:hypothetical protein